MIQIPASVPWDSVVDSMSQTIMYIQITQGSRKAADSDSVVLRQHSRVCIFIKLPGDADAAGH